MSLSETAKKNFERVTQFATPTSISPETAASMEFVFGKVWSGTHLSWREKRLISLTCTAIVGNQMPLETHIRGALKSGDLSLDDLREFGLHLSVYGGFPVAAPLDGVFGKIAAEMPGKK